MNLHDDIDIEKIKNSPKNSIGPNQCDYGNCILISSTKVILRNIIVVLLNS